MVVLVVDCRSDVVQHAGRPEQLALEGDPERLRLLCAIIRLAEQLERSRDGAIRNVSVATANGSVTLAADGDPALDTTVPIWAARQSAGLLADALDREVEIA